MKKISEIAALRGRNDVFKLQVNLGDLCNFKCSYCIQQNHTQKNNPNQCIELGRLLGIKCEKYLKSRLEKCPNSVLFLLGGEPTLYPIPEFYRALGLKFKTVAIVTNLSKPILYYMQLARDIQSLGAKLQIRASYHEEYFTKEDFIKKAQTLSSLNISVTISSLVVTESNFNEVLSAAEFFAEKGLVTTVKIARKTDRTYFDITPEQVQAINNFNMHFGINAAAYKVEYDDGTTDIVGRVEDLFVKADSDFSIKGLYCNQPQHLLHVDSTGNVFTNWGCRQQFTFGNLYEDEILDIPELVVQCPSEFCYCWFPSKLSRKPFTM